MLGGALVELLLLLVYVFVGLALHTSVAFDQATGFITLSQVWYMWCFFIALVILLGTMMRFSGRRSGGGY